MITAVVLFNSHLASRTLFYPQFLKLFFPNLISGGPLAASVAFMFFQAFRTQPCPADVASHHSRFIYIVFVNNVLTNFADQAGNLLLILLDIFFDLQVAYLLEFLLGEKSLEVVDIDRSL
jgi:hydroxyacyl-ACP dehydratase HTD2-like protein with hotdog domain